MINIFENAYFGKPYKTRDEKKAIIVAQTLGKYKLIIQDKFGFEEFHCNESGSHINLMGESPSILDIVSEWKKPINKEELDKRAKKYADKYAIPNTFEYTIMEAAYKNGYKQGLEDKQ